MMQNNIIICRKLDVLRKYYEELKRLSEELSLERYLQDLLIRRAIERQLHSI
ncbi:MAG: hypothetical protein ACOX27_00495 [Caldicoprobacterales bacterium]|jgi:hypothetical protein|nr:hypothetical protein [Clostridiales bacterium]